MNTLRDSLDRSFSYLRLSVTDQCNFRCVYCLPNGYKADLRQSEGELSVAEIHNLVVAMASLGVTKVRLTGGEPTLRRDLLEIAGAIASVPGIRKLALSTNGHSLERNAGRYRSAGFTAVNVSLDSMDQGRFRQITGSGRYQEILNGIDAALEAGIPTVKANCVLMKDLNDADLPLFMNWVRHRPVTIRFIELMQTGGIGELFGRHHIRSNFIHSQLIRSGWVPCAKSKDDGPALEYRHADHVGRIGIIAPYAESFCKSCNRLRISSRGRLQLCLFGAGDLNIRPLLSRGVHREKLCDRIQAALKQKLPTHRLHMADAGQTLNLSKVGG